MRPIPADTVIIKRVTKYFDKGIGRAHALHQPGRFFELAKGIHEVLGGAQLVFACIGTVAVAGFVLKVAQKYSVFGALFVG